MKNYLLLLFVFSFFHLLTAQTYSIDQYAARYERRPLLEIHPRINFSGLYVPAQENAQSDANGSLNVFWREESNLEDRIQAFQVSFGGQLDNDNYDDELLRDRFSSGLQLRTKFDRYNYHSNNRFWGFNNQFDFLYSHQNNDLNGKVNNTNINLAPGIFAGSGRIEYAEDAILANWMMDDLLETGTISSATPEQRKLLAQRITSIIGNRTFDLRKRRIYELQQLQSLFQEQELAIKDDFSLFAILNDNWVFARRATLPHGKRWKYGLDGAVDLANFDSQQIDFNNFTTRLNPYLEREAAYIKNNNSAHVFSGRLGVYLQDVVQSEDVSFMDEEYSYGTRLDLGYQLIWLPISRTRLIWDNSFNVDLSQIKRTDVSSEEFNSTYTFSSNLSYDYFIGPQWILQLTAGLRIANDVFDDHTVRPYLGLSSQYFVF